MNPKEACDTLANCRSTVLAPYRDTLEGCAFLLYPVAMQAFSLRFLMVCWSASSIVNAVFGGYVFFHEEPNAFAIVGCVLVIAGVVTSTL